MIKYRKLTLQELEPLKEEFLKFLLVQNMYPEQWEVLKKENPAEAERQLDAFSDIVFEKILTEIQFIEKITDKRIEAYHFGKETAQMMTLQAKEGTNVDFTIQPLSEINPANYELISGSKKVGGNRNQELYSFMERGAVKSDGMVYKKIALLLAQSKS
jgi:hypothetical protein